MRACVQRAELDIQLTQKCTNYKLYTLLPISLQAVAKFMERVRGGKAKFDPNRIVMSGGATGANETIMFCLADPGDAFLVPSPYYPAYELTL